MMPEEAQQKAMKLTPTLIDSATDRTAKQQAKEKMYHDKRARSMPQRQVSDLVFVDTPPAWGGLRPKACRMNPEED